MTDIPVRGPWTVRERRAADRLSEMVGKGVAWKLAAGITT